MMQTECLVTGSNDTRLDITVRFLHLLVRHRRRPARPSPADQADVEREGADPHLQRSSWEEGMEREVEAPDLALADLIIQPRQVAIDFSGRALATAVARTDEDADELEQVPIAGSITIAAAPVAADGDGGNAGLFKLRVQIANTTPDLGTDRDIGAASGDAPGVPLASFVSTHTILRVRQGAFISLLDPPALFQAAAQACQNQHTWPVLVGEAGERDTLLSSPIILYDYPQIAPESPGALFDGTEIDELLTLRIMTLTDEEKAEIRQGDARAQEILERTEALAPEQLLKLHGAIRSLRPSNEGGAG